MDGSRARHHRNDQNGAFQDRTARRPQSRNKHWVSEQATSIGGIDIAHANGHAERWERGGFRGGRGRGRGMIKRLKPVVLHPNNRPDGVEVGLASDGERSETEDDGESHELEEREPETQEERDRFYAELIKAREAERKLAILEGKMDDPLKPKRLEDAITMVGTCMDMCPRFERYRRERQNNLTEWEVIPGTKRVDHKSAVKMYERAAGDKTLPSDLRPPKVLKRTLDYLFHDLLPRRGFSATFSFIRDRSRAVRNDFTMQHETGPIAIECHDRCVRFHILAIHIERDNPGFSIPLEEQQLMNTLQSLKEFYEDQRGRYQSPTELEMRVYHRLIHIRDQKERHEDIPGHILSHPVFKLTSKFRAHVQAKSAPITKSSPLVVDAPGMQIFADLASVLREEGSMVMIFLVACILERLFGKDAIDDIEEIRGDLSLPDIIDGYSGEVHAVEDEGVEEDLREGAEVDEGVYQDPTSSLPLYDSEPLKDSSVSTFTTPSTSVSVVTQSSVSFPQTPGLQSTKSAFANLVSVPNAFGNQKIFGTFSSTSPKPQSAFTPEIARPVLEVRKPVNTGVISDSHDPSIFHPPIGLVPSSAFTSSPLSTNHLIDLTEPVASAASDIPSLYHQSNPSSPSQAFINQIEPSMPEDLTSFNTSRASASTNAPHANSQSSAPSFISWSSLSPVSIRKKPFFSSGTPTVSHAPSVSITAPARSDSFGAFKNRSIVQSPSKRPRRASELYGFPDSSSTSIPEVTETKEMVSSASLSELDASATPTRPAADVSTNEPPLLMRHQPISLPPTPTIRSFPSIGTPRPVKSILGSAGHLQTSSVSTAPTEILSPLILQSPSSSTSLLSVSTMILDSTLFPRPGAAVENENTGSFQTADVPTPRPLSGGTRLHDGGSDAKAAALAFCWKGLLVRDTFRRWRQRTRRRIEWDKACRRSDAYSEKVQNEQPRRVSEHSSERKRRSDVSSSPMPLQKRLRKRNSKEVNTRLSDEDLAERFAKNKEELEHRWARGTFLQQTTYHIESLVKPSSMPLARSVWLSLNPGNDGTAIWMERKFDIPNSGDWKDDSIFSIALATKPQYSESPAPVLIIFESTPLDRVCDELERKFYVLEDCARLRGIIHALPPKRFFLPSLLTITWSQGNMNITAPDLQEMIDNLLDKNIIFSHQDFTVTSHIKELDLSFGETLKSMALDVDGTLAKRLSLTDLISLLDFIWRKNTMAWLDSCSINGDFDWALHGNFLALSVGFLSQILQQSFKLLSVAEASEVFPEPDFADAIDSESTFNATGRWLQQPALRDSTTSLMSSMQSFRNMKSDFPSRTFLDQLFEHTKVLIRRHVHGKPAFYVLKSDYFLTKQSLEETAMTFSEELEEARTLRIRRSPKRHYGPNENLTDRSPGPTKRRRLSPSDASTNDHDQSPSPTLLSNQTTPPMDASSTSLADDSVPISAAMLRALAREVVSKYSNSSLTSGT